LDLIGNRVIFDCKEFINSEIDKNFIEALTFLKKESMKFLVNYQDIVNGIFKKNKEILTEYQKNIFIILNK